MTEKTQETIIAKFVKSSGVMVFLEGQATGIPCELKILSIIKKGDKVQAGNEYRWLINIDAKGNRAIVNVGPADEDAKFKTGKEILQENRDKLAAEKSKPPAAAKTPAPAGVKNLPDECKTCIFVHDCSTLEPKENCKRDAEAQINLAKQAEQIAAKNKEDEEYARKLAAERQNKEPKKGLPTQKAPVTVVPAKVVEEVPQNQSVAVLEAPLQHIQLSQKRQFNPDEINLIKSTVAKDCTNTEFKFLMYLASEYNLDPIRRQIWCIKYGDNPATIFTGRDGFLQIAHRSGQFDGMKSWVEYAKDAEGNDDYSRPIKGHCTVWRKDMTQPFETEVLFQEYVIPQQPGKKPTLWQTKPSVMILKVSESVCLRKAFAVTGLYSPEEMGQ